METVVTENNAKLVVAIECGICNAVTSLSLLEPSGEVWECYFCNEVFTNSKVLQYTLSVAPQALCYLPRKSMI